MSNHLGKYQGDITQLKHVMGINVVRYKQGKSHLASNELIGIEVKVDDSLGLVISYDGLGVYTIIRPFTLECIRAQHEELLIIESRLANSQGTQMTHMGGHGYDIII